TNVLPEPSFVGQPYTVYFTVTTPNGIPTGTVAIKVDGNAACSAAVSVGHCDITPSSAGTFGLVAFYSGDQNFDLSQSPAVDHTVKPVYTIAASAGGGGSISPSGSVSVNSGGDQSFNITPDFGYHIADVLVDTVTVGA